MEPYVRLNSTRQIQTMMVCMTSLYLESALRIKIVEETDENVGKGDKLFHLDRLILPLLPSLESFQTSGDVVDQQLQEASHRVPEVDL
jgi:hypothetical protein